MLKCWNKQTPNVYRFPSQCFNTYFHWDTHMFRSVKYVSQYLKQFVLLRFIFHRQSQTVLIIISAPVIVRRHSYLFLFFLTDKMSLLLSQPSYLTALPLDISVLKVWDYSSLISSILRGIAQGITQKIF